MKKENKNELIVLKKESIFSKITNFIKSFFNKKAIQTTSAYQEEKAVQTINVLEKETSKPKTLEEKLAAVDKIPGLDEDEKLKRKIRILDANDKKIREQMMERVEVTRITDSEYYKDIYNKINSGEIGVDELTNEEFSKVIKMQKLEYELITNKLKDAMNNL